MAVEIKTLFLLIDYFCTPIDVLKLLGSGQLFAL